MSETRNQILEAAGKLFLERGYEMVGVNELIEKSGVAKATFYAHFKSKSGLCSAWLQGLADRVRAANRELLDAPMDAEGKLRLFYAKLELHLTQTGFHNCPFSTTASMADDDVELHRVIREFKAESRLFWQHVAEHSGADRPAAVGDSLFLLYSGALAEAQSFQDAWPIRNACEASCHLIRRA